MRTLVGPLICLAVMLGGAAPGCTLPVPATFEVAEFPGFSLEVPSWFGRRFASMQYSMGSMSHAKGLLVTWTMGPMMTAEQYAGALGNIAKVSVSPDALVPVPAASGAGWKVRTTMRGKPVVLALLPCGSRVVQVVASWPDLADKVADRMLASFDCHPDPARERALGTERPFDVPEALIAGWTRVTGERDFVLQRGDGKVQLFARETSANASISSLWRFLDESKSYGLRITVKRTQFLEVPGGLRAILSGAVHGMGSFTHIGLTLIECNQRPVVLTVTAKDEAAFADAARILSAATCK